VTPPKFVFLNQSLARSILDASLASRHFPSFIFAGPRGVGKRTLALRYAQAANCLAEGERPCGSCSECVQVARLGHPDVKLIMPLKPETQSEDESRRTRDAQRLVDETMTRAAEFGLGKTRPESEAKWQIPISVIHWLRKEMAYAPQRGRRRVVIVIDADQMNPVSANAFLKTLEEPQRQTSFILVTERSHKLLDTIRSRCQTVGFACLPRRELAGLLMERCNVGEKQAKLAAEVSGGSLRKALDYLEAPDDFLVPQAREFFMKARPTLDDCRTIVDQADRIPIEGVIDSLTFLHDQALKASLGLESEYISQNPDLKSRVAGLDAQLMRRQLEVLLKARREFEFNVNRRLFLFALLSTLTASG